MFFQGPCITQNKFTDLIISVKDTVVYNAATWFSFNEEHGKF